MSPVGRVLGAAVLALVAAASLRAEDGRPPILRGVAFEQRIGQQVPLDLELADETGRPVRLGEYFGRKPVRRSSRRCSRRRAAESSWCAPSLIASSGRRSRRRGSHTDLSLSASPGDGGVPRRR